MLYNYPLNAFDKRKYMSSFSGGTEAGEAFLINKRTLGLSLFAPEQPLGRTAKVKTVGDLLKAISGYYFNAEAVLSEEIFGDANQRRSIQVCFHCAHLFARHVEIVEWFVMVWHDSSGLWWFQVGVDCVDRGVIFCANLTGSL